MEEIAEISRVKPHKKWLVAGGALAVCLLLGLVWLARPQAAEEPLRREYPVSRKDITVGIDAAGNIQSEQWGQFAPVTVTLKEYKVRVGDKVAEGDVLAEYDADALQQLAQEKNTQLTQKQSELDALIQQKSDADSQLQQKIDQLREAGSKSKDAELRTLEQKKQELNATIQQYLQAIKTAQQEKEDLLTKNGQRAQVIADCDSRLTQLEEQHTQLQEKLNALIEEGAPEEQLQQVRQELAQNEVDTADVKRTREEAVTTDYEALAAEKQQLADQEEAARKQAQTQLDQLEQTIRNTQNAQQSLRQEEDRQIESLKQQTATEQTSLDSKLAAARQERDRVQTEYSELLALCKDPTLRADRAGTVTALGGTPGVSADPSSPLAKIGDETQRHLVLQVDPVDVSQIQPGQEVSFYVDAYPDATFYGKVESVSQLQNDAGKFEVRASFQSGEEPLYDGMGANATLIVKQKKDVLAISNKAIQFEDGKSYVFLQNEDGTLRRQPVTTGFSNGKLTEILDGLQQDDVAVVEETYEDR